LKETPYPFIFSQDDSFFSTNQQVKSSLLINFIF
jgi:hypothetical protein